VSVRRRSIRARTTVGATVIVAVAMVVGSWFLVDQQRHALLGSVETTARLRVDDLVAELGDGTVPEAVSVPFEDESFAQIVDDAGLVVRASPNIEGEPRVARFVPPLDRYESRSLPETPVGDSSFRVVARRVDVPAGTLVVYVGQSLKPVTEGTRALVRSLLLGVPLLLAVVAGMTWIVAGRALRPVDAMRAEVDSIGERELHRRIADPGTGDEVARLARTMNAMLDRLDGAADRQRRFVADASHELRSPLTGIRAQLEVDLAHPEQADWQNTEHEVLQDTMRLQRLVDDLLILAHAEGVDAPVRVQVVDLDDLVLREVRRVRQRGAVTIDASAVRAVQALVDPDAMARVVHNLLDNAERHARSSVSITLDEVDGGVELTASDDGPGIPSADRDRVFERFARADEARGRDAGGTGLGLAIAREIITAHGGTLRVLDTVGGAAFQLRLPTS